MAESNECFNIGSTVTCKTCFNEDLQGEVLAFDPHVKLLTLKSPSSNGRSATYDIHMVNLSYVSQVTVMREAAGSPLPSLPSLNLSKLSNRAKKSIDEKQRLIEAMQSGVSPVGQKLFLHIRKTMEEVKWAGVSILVMGQVIISPPYQLENVKEQKEGKESNSKTLPYVKKLVDKFHQDQQSLSLNNGTSATPVVAEVQPVSQ
ncbi:protein LSM12 homolog [Portunus trituberculatus]|uniref:protein LSM12 homolog n=1 Tax=Portunus trituberculatus TaxID=210409 RepID=UPI001E1CBB40|nr:protein LSM12 homolog [Portunus trituberculatus]XP_045103363.1 protein LSM12 homolog [Portunus trituberculatus]XP_045103364.1 protein LSM12 homolog [Portunus trituberculatus]